MGIASCLEILRVKTNGQWNIQESDILEVFRLIRTVYREENDGVVQTDESMYILLAKENGAQILTTVS